TIEIPVTLQVDTSLKISKHIGMLYLKQDEKQINIPYIVCVDPKDYPFLSMNGPFQVSNDKFPYLLEYYSPFSVEQLSIFITGQTDDNQPFSSVLMEKNTPSKGYQEFKWDGRDQNKKIVPNGTYELTITAKDSSQSYQISQHLTISGTDEKTVEAPKVNKVTDQDTKVTGTGEKGAIVKVTVDGKEIGTGTVDDQGNFTVNIPKQPGGKEVVVTLTDMAGNVSKLTKTKLKIDPSEEGQKNINKDHQVIDTNSEDARNGNITKVNGSTMNSQYQGNLPKTGGKEGMMDTLLGLGAITMAFFVRRMK
ncbi:Ig-like domain-containing protein, partial [Bacillus cereus]|uniref:Ig-like domain-containing protein n=1 Tax=Bacillus cereus TaxID=1396 RepID=UPI000279D19C